MLIKFLRIILISGIIIIPAFFFLWGYFLFDLVSTYNGPIESLNNFIYNVNQEKALRVGYLGESFSPLSAFFSAAAVLGVLLTLYVQMKESREHQKNLEEILKKMTRLTNNQQKMIDAHQLTAEINGWEAITRGTIALESISPKHREEVNEVIDRLRDRLRKLKSQDLFGE